MLGISPTECLELKNEKKIKTAICHISGPEKVYNNTKKGDFLFHQFVGFNGHMCEDTH